MQTRREELIYLGKNNPKRLWQALQPRKKQFENNITANQWFDYARKLYEKELEVEPSTHLQSFSQYMRWRQELKS